MSSSISQKIKNLCQQWLTYDADPSTRQEIFNYMESGNEKELTKCLEKRIDFGTAGLRGEMRAGFSFMNNLTVIQATQGLAVYLDRMIPHAHDRGVVIGFDSRHHSREFADCAAAYLSHHGYHIHFFSTVIPTPLVSFAVVQLNAAAGIMITASHNPKQDNGYKVYWDNGAQIIEPHDHGIRTCILENQAPWPLEAGTVKSSLQGPLSSLIHIIDTQVIQAYLSCILSLSYYHDKNANGQVSITYTAMHGVGSKLMTLAFDAFGLKPFIPTLSQAEPDPDFPTIHFPNPEEGKGALKCAFATADSHHSPLVIANDPDADRLAVAERLPHADWRVLTGNELGILLMDWVWTNYLSHHPQVDRSKILVATSAVSSKMLQALAHREGLTYVETLTGFKWIGNVVHDAKLNRGFIPLYAFEESIGYMIGDICLEKDGIRAGVVFAEMANYYYSQHTTCLDQLQRIHDQLGYYISCNSYFFCYDPQVLVRIFDKIRNQGRYVSQLGPYQVVSIRDLTTPGYDSTQPDHRPILPISASTQMITFTLSNGACITLRGSGTEPKLKYYIEVAGKPGQDKVSVQQELTQVVQPVIHEWLNPEAYGLEAPTQA